MTALATMNVTATTCQEGQVYRVMFRDADGDHLQKIGRALRVFRTEHGIDVDPNLIELTLSTC